ncbi:hypothetical protein BJ944DRAFT_232023 [Cunninghamella echinulata]|nr:hypothetical protein BJ944DRAFT_232023 [Cunninghamella echinulata]
MIKKKSIISRLFLFKRSKSKDTNNNINHQQQQYRKDEKIINLPEKTSTETTISDKDRHSDDDDDDKKINDFFFSFELNDKKKELLLKEFHDITTLLKTSKQKQRILSLLKNPGPNITSIILTNIKRGNQYNHQYSIISPPYQLYYLLKLYTTSLQKLKQYDPPCSIEKQQAIYHILSYLSIQKEAFHPFEPDFDPIGKKPRKTRYISVLLDTPIDCIQPYLHPVVQACKRKPFIETIHVITPASFPPSSSSSSYMIHDLDIKTKQPYQQPFHPSDPSLSSSSSSTLYSDDDVEGDDDIPLGILKSIKPNHYSKLNIFHKLIKN